MRRILGIETLGGGRFLVQTEEGDAFPMYKGELRHYGIREGEELGEESFREIMEELLPNRAKKKALHLLERMDRTETQLRQKLTELRYPKEIVEEAVSYVKSFHYIDDVRYARQYIESRRERESIRQMRMALLQKGIAGEILDGVLQDTEPPDEEKQIRRWMEKRQYDPEAADEKERARMYRFLLRKGYSCENIRNLLG
ncbi:MAG TPA: regulatory protein RecX [Candidatus Choladousia intestinavium]|uniref:Regulatory protein RecX n=1 Tax=Candidatus Choladousia intestinavium TaxID=2840727 RepID=A0A9D1AAU9_9FIRM|nr:regulatory protein RecX [Candidatus Choladousia intestinavium]